MRYKLSVLAAIVSVSLLAFGAALAWGGHASADDPTPTPEPCQGVCVAGFWDIDYTGSVFGKCQELTHQSGASTLWGEISCTHVALGVYTATLDQGTLIATGVIQFQQPAVTVATSRTYSSDGNSAASTWTCTAGCPGPNSGSANLHRIPDHYETPIPASSGGELTTALNDTLTVPAGALPHDEEVTIDIHTLPVAPPPDLKPLTRAYTFGPAGLEFITPVTVTFQYTENDLAGGSIDPATLRVYIYRPESGLWDLVGGDVDTMAMTITVQLDHFSTYAILGEPPATPTPPPTDTPTATPTATPKPPQGVGGTVKLPPAALAAESAKALDGSGWSVGAYAALAGAAAAVVVLVSGGWYVQRRRRAR